MVKPYLFFRRILTAVFLCVGGATFAQSSGPLDISADKFEYLMELKITIARGNVEIREGDAILRADYMSVQTETGDIHALGNVRFQRGTETWQGEEFRYNLRTGEGDFGRFKAFFDPFYVTAEGSRRISDHEYRLTGVKLTTCDSERPEISIRANEASIVSNRVSTKGAAVYVADTIPIFYMPYYSRSLDSHERFFQFLPGYNSRLGAFLLTAYNYPLAEGIRGITHLDYRSRRGPAFGQDITWKDKEQTYEGIVQGYYLNDDSPFRGPAEELREQKVEEERYRLRLAHSQRFSDRDTLRLEANYLSDPYVLKDFFRKEFRDHVQPENRLTLSHRGDTYLASMQINKRLNDFYENVDRVPEFGLDIPRVELGESGFFYESRNSASYLERVFEKQSANEDYDAVRVNTDHTIYYPFRLNGFLNLIPRAGYQGTYYSQTYDRRTVTNSEIIINTDGSAFVSNTVASIVEEKGGALRHLPQIGWEASFKAFSTRNDLIILGDGDGLRHVVEPYIDYTYRPEPNLRPHELPQFDAIDALDKRHDMRLGVRNKWQTRRDRNVVDFIDLNLYTIYRLEANEGENDFSDFFLRGEFRPHRSMLIEVDGAFDSYESDVSEFNTRASWLLDNATRIGIEQRYRLDTHNLAGASLNLLPKERWSFELGFRYDLDESELQEHYYMVKRKGQCVSWGLGLREIYDNDDNELEVWLMVWLNAFPDALISLDY